MNMKGIVFLLAMIFVAAVMNAESFGTISVILVGIYIFYMLSTSGKSVTELTKEDPALSHKKEQAVTNMLTDFGKVTSCLIKGKDADLSGKTLVKSTHKITADTVDFLK